MLIADDASANRWLVHALEAQGLLHAVVRPDWQAPRPTAPSSGTRSRVSMVTRVRRRVRRWYFARVDRDASDRLAHLLAPPSGTRHVPVHVVPAWSINAEETVAYVRAAAPDLLVVSGAPLLQPALYQSARWGAINVHFGESPTYRGMHTLVVPWWRGDFAHVGATVHRIDDGIDTGPAFVRVYPRIAATDDAVTIEAALVRDTAQAVCQLLIDFATRAEGPPPGTRLSGTGTLIRFHDRRIRDHLWYRWRRWRGERPPAQAPRVERLY